MASRPKRARCCSKSKKMALGSSVSPPSTGASTGCPFAIAPMAELEVPKSSPQARMRTPSLRNRGSHLLGILRPCQSVSLRLGSRPIVGCPENRPSLFCYSPPPCGEVGERSEPGGGLTFAAAPHPRPPEQVRGPRPPHKGEVNRLSEHQIAAVDHEGVGGVVAGGVARQINRDAAEIGRLAPAPHRHARQHLLREHRIVLHALR